MILPIYQHHRRTAVVHALHVDPRLLRLADGGHNEADGGALVAIDVGDSLAVEVGRHPLGGTFQIFVEGRTDGGFEALHRLPDQSIQGGVLLLGKDGNVGQEAVALTGKDTALDELRNALNERIGEYTVLDGEALVKSV